MNLMFWKKKTGTAEEAENEQENPAASTKPGLAAGMKLRLGALLGYFRKTPAFRADDGHAPDAPGGSEAAPEGEHLEEASDTGSMRSRKRLIIGGAIGLLILLLVGIGIAIWPASTPPQERLDAGHEVAATASGAIQPEHAPQPVPAPQNSQPESAPQNPQTEIEALKKENAELQARIEALKKEQQPPSQAARQAGRSASSSSVGGEVRVGNEDPKAAAMSLKEAIEAMNASSGDYKKKHAK